MAYEKEGNDAGDRFNPWAQTRVERQAREGARQAFKPQPKAKPKAKPRPKAKTVLPKAVTQKPPTEQPGGYERYRRGERGQAPAPDIFERYNLKKQIATEGRPDEYVPSYMNPKFQDYLQKFLDEQAIAQGGGTPESALADYRAGERGEPGFGGNAPAPAGPEPVMTNPPDVAGMREMATREQPTLAAPAAPGFNILDWLKKLLGGGASQPLPPGGGFYPKPKPWEPSIDWDELLQGGIRRG